MSASLAVTFHERAAIPHPNFLKMMRDRIIIVNVTVPVAVEKLLMNAE
jgi:hypothetical protein